MNRTATNPTGASRDAGRVARWWTWGVGAAALYWSAAMFLRPARLLMENGHGYQLAGAGEILAGRHPFIDFQDVYGPLAHYASAAGLWVCGERVAGELLVCSLGFAVGHVIFFRLLLALGAGRVIALGATLLTLLVQSAPYRYYMLLCPMIFLGTAWRYVAAPVTARMGGMALAVAVGGLFRPDFGVLGFLAGAIAVWCVPQNAARRARLVALFAAFIVAAALPWLVWLALRGHLGDYLINSSGAAAAMNSAEGMGRPAVGLSFSNGWWTEQNAKAVLLRLPLATLVLALVGVWRWRAAIPESARPWLWCAVAYAVFSQAQAEQIGDWLHARDPLPVRILLLAWICVLAARAMPSSGGANVSRRLTWGAAGVAAALLALAGAHHQPLRQLKPAGLAAKVRDYWERRPEFLARIPPWESFRPAFYGYLRAHSAPDESVLAVTEAPQMNFFAERRLVGGQLALLPGYFASPRDQTALVAALRDPRTALVVVVQEAQPNYPDLRLANFAPIVWACLTGDFQEVARFNAIRVLAPRARIRPGTEEHWTPRRNRASPVDSK
ncbi:MAG: hypothetical protein RLZZ15_896 [Verrucomicrobiota bacterium]